MGYYQFVYPFVVAYGSFVGILKYIWEVKLYPPLLVKLARLISHEFIPEVHPFDLL